MPKTDITGPQTQLEVTRRSFVTGAKRTTLSAGAVLMLAGCGTGGYSRSASAESLESDLRILNTALSAEHEAIAAYQVGAESGLLSNGVLQLAVKFQGHHREHAEVLADTVKELGGTPEDAKAKYDFPVDKLKSQADVLGFAAGLEKGAVSAYLGAVPLFANRDLAKAAASILGDEAMHWAVLRNALGLDPVPVAFVS